MRPNTWKGALDSSAGKLTSKRGRDTPVELSLMRVGSIRGSNAQFNIDERKSLSSGENDT